jgi:hypothetical protein
LTSVSAVERRNRLGGKRSSVPLQHAAGVVGLDQALDGDGEIGDRSLGQHMRDIAERILMHVEPRIGGDIDLPFATYCPSWLPGVIRRI